jgi:hypothetical protein
MKRTQRSRTVIVALAVLAVLGGASAGTILAAGGEATLRAGNLVVHAKVAFSPKALPKNEMAPVTLHARGSVETADGSHVPAVQSVHMQTDQNLRIDTSGLPSCTVGKLEAALPAEAMRACGAALIGKGIASAEVEFPESAPFSAKGPLLGFNGPKVGGDMVLLFYVHVAVPAPTVLVDVVTVAKGSGKYGYTITQEIPKLAGGSGSLTGFEVSIGRRWTFKRRQHSFLSAECPNGRFTNQFEAAFADGSILKGDLVFSCQPKG